MRIVQVPRFVEVQDGGRPYYTIASRTLAARKAVDVEPQPASAAFADAMPPNMEQELVARMGRLNWDYVLRVLFSTTKKIEIQTGEVVLANDVRGTRALTRIAYPKHDIEGYSAAVRDFIRDCIRFWDSVDREVARLENDALRARERPVEQEAGQRGATLP
ncbi:MAG: hypothetical protein EHM61_04020 [Acidobacteria bacterium]|nr:MAG: hypothetical protein EHM61_04020 [Acidobacteriota bacterium]